MGAYGELFGRKLKHDGDPAGPGRKHDPGGPLDLERGVVFLAPPRRPTTGSDHEETAQDEPGRAGPAQNEHDH